MLVRDHRCSFFVLFSATWRTFYCAPESQIRGVVSLFELASSERNSPCGKDLKRNILTGK